MSDQYLHILKSLSLTSIDKETVDAFKSNPNGRVFLPISEILRKYGHENDSMQLLMTGVHLHPSYSAARVVLAKYLYESSMFNESWDILEQSPTSLRENKTAQILKFRLSLVLGFEDKFNFLVKDMNSRGQLDAQLKHIHEELGIKGFHEVRRDAINTLKVEGLDVSSLESTLVDEPQLSQEHKDPDEDAPQDPVLLGRLIEGFYVSPISEIFNKPDEGHIDPDKHDLDAVTLAQVYRKQGRYQKSLEIYQRLLYMAPNNDLFKKQVEELQSLWEEQHRQEQSLDPDLVERLDELQGIESRMAILNKLLARLDEEASQDT